jgi:hypothetical protein
MTQPATSDFKSKLDHMIAVYDKAGPMAEEQTKTLRQCRAALQTVNAINERLASEAWLLREDAKGLAQTMRADPRDLNDPLWQDVISFLESF